MCIAVAQTAGARMLTFDTFEQCYTRNKDGLGMAWINWAAPHPDKRIRIMRSSRNSNGDFDLERFYDFYRRTHLLWGKHSPFMLHFRYTTHGDTDQYNCHPFRVKPRLAMMHNGVLPMPPAGKGIKNLFHDNQVLEKYSDTWHYAKLYFPKFGYLSFHGWLKEATEQFIGTGNKLVFLDANRYSEAYRKKGFDNLIIYNEEQGEWHEGTWYSNTAWRPYVAPPKRMCRSFECKEWVYVSNTDYCWTCRNNGKVKESTCGTPWQSCSSDLGY